MSRHSQSRPLSQIPVEFTVKRRRNQKHINLRVTHMGDLVISAPYGASMSRIHSAIRQKQAWIDRHMRRAALRRPLMDPRNGVLLDGQRYAVLVTPTTRVRERIRVDEAGRTLTVETHDTRAECVMGLLARWMRRRASSVLRRRVAELADARGIHVGKVYIRDQKTRWGSSSAKGNISLNWRSIMAPFEVRDYLIYHELAHQRHMNHSPRFWGVVEHWCTNVDQAGSWLKEHSYLLSTFRPVQPE